MRTAFRIVAGLLGVLAVVFSVPFAVISLFDSGDPHQLHNQAFVASNGLLLGVPLLLSAWRPEEDVSAFLVAVASGIAGAIGGLASGDFISGLWFTAPLTIVILWWLHPSRSRLLRPEGIHAPTLVLSAAALLPAVAFLLTQSELQRNGLAGDEHWEFHHYSGMAVVGLAPALCGVAASLRTTGRTIGVWLVGLSAVTIGVASLLLSDHVGAIDPLWAWLALAWGIAVVVPVVGHVPDRLKEPTLR